MGQEQSQAGAGKSESPTNESEVRQKPITKQKAKIGDIVVVKDVPDAPKESTDETLAKLKRLKLTYPIIKNVGGVPIEGLDLLPGLNPDPITEMLLRYQYHLTECAEAVAFDQNSITKRIKEVEAFSARVFKESNDRQKQIDQLLMNMQKIFEIDLLIDRISQNMDKTSRLMLRLNEYLPESERFSNEVLAIRNETRNLSMN